MSQDSYIFPDIHARPQWDEWESIRIIQVVQNALISVGQRRQVMRLPPNTPVPALAQLGPRQLLAQAWRQVDMKHFQFPSHSCIVMTLLLSVLCIHNCCQVYALHYINGWWQAATSRHEAGPGQASCRAARNHYCWGSSHASGLALVRSCHYLFDCVHVMTDV